MVTGLLKYAEPTLQYAGKSGQLQILTSEKCTVTLKERMTASLLQKYTLFFYKNNFASTKALILANNSRTSQEQSHNCCPTEHKNKMPRLAILKIIRTKHQHRAWLSLTLYCMQTSFKLRTIPPKNHENFKNSKPSVQYYWFLYKKECSTSE